MSQHQDVRVLDEQLLAEIDLMTELMVTATSVDGSLCEHMIDAVLSMTTGGTSRSAFCACHPSTEQSASPTAVPSPRQGL